MERNAVEECTSDAVGLHLADLLAVDVEGYLLEVGIDTHVGQSFCAVGEAARSDVDHRFGIPVGLVEPEGILLRGAVVGDEALVVEAVLFSLFALIGLDVGKMPDGLAPKVRTCAEASPVALVAGGLRFFGMEVSVGLVGIVERPAVLID